MITIEAVRYNIPHPPSLLRHKRRSLLDVFLTWLVMTIGSSHICQICRRVEQSSKVSGWLQIDHEAYKDKDGGSVVCQECTHSNPEIFDL